MEHRPLPDPTIAVVSIMLEKRWLALLLIITVAVRLCLSLAACDIIDVHNYARVAAIVRNYGIIALYAQTPGIYPYPPVWVWFEILAQFLSETSGLRFGLLIRLPIILADTGIAYLIWTWYHDRMTTERLFWGAAYALNPVSLIITCLHGQFDAIPAFLALLAVYWAQLRRLCLSAIILGLAIAFKLYPVLLLPLVLLELKGHKQRLAFATIAIAPTLLFTLPFGLYMPAAVMRELFLYKGVALLGMLVPARSVYVPLAHDHFPLALTQQIISASRWLFVVGYVGLVARQALRPIPLSASCVAILLWFYVAYAGISPQYLVWTLPFLLTLGANSVLFAGTYTLAAALALYGFYAYAVPETFCLLPSLPLWLSRLLYGLFGTLWWLTSGVLLIWLGGRRQTARKPEP